MIEKAEQRLGSGDDGTHRIRIMRTEELRRVVAIGKHHDAQVDRITTTLDRRLPVDEFARAIRRLLARGITVEEIDNARGEAADELDMLGRERRAERGDDVFDAGPVHGDDIGIALHDDGLAAVDDGILRNVDTEHVR